MNNVKAEQPGDVVRTLQSDGIRDLQRIIPSDDECGIARDIAGKVLDTYEGHTGKKIWPKDSDDLSELLDACEDAVLDALPAPQAVLAALSPSVPAEAVAWMIEDFRSPARFSTDPRTPVMAASRPDHLCTPLYLAPPANDEWRAAIVKRLAELGLFAADEQDDPALAVSTLETIAASANDEAVRRIEAALKYNRNRDTYTDRDEQFRLGCVHGLERALELLASQQEEKG